jgi:hypothetical protein
MTPKTDREKYALLMQAAATAPPASYSPPKAWQLSPCPAAR